LRTLYIHVGPAKTGTSAIQRLLRAHDESVVIYPKVGLWDDGAHHNLVLNFFGYYIRPDITVVDPAILLADMAHALDASERNAVISSEMLSGRVDVGRLVNALSSLPMRHPMAVELLVVCRDHFELAASTYNQLVKDEVLRERQMPDDFLRSHGGEFGYEELIGRLRATGAKVTALNYHPAAGLVERFLCHIGFVPHQVPAAQMHNVSLSHKGLVAMLATNNLAMAAQQRQRVFDALRKMPGFFAASSFIFGVETVREMLPRFQADRQFLETQFGIRLPARELTNQAAGPRLGDADVYDIRAALAALGSEADAIVEFAAAYQRRLARS
jgi:hypothetical protein